MIFGKALPHQISITPTNNFGYFVKVGCAIFSYNDPEKLIEDFSAYIRNPKNFEEKYNENNGNPCAAVQPAPPIGTDPYSF
jgi:hypothetical protein